MYVHEMGFMLNLNPNDNDSVFFPLFSASLASLTRETGPKVIRGDPERKGEAPLENNFEHHSKPHFTLQPNISDSALKFTHIMYNLSPAGQHFKNTR